MKNLKDIILGHLEYPKFSIYERLHINKDTGNNSYNYYPKTSNELEELIKKLIKERGNNADLNDIDTSEITDMQFMFYGSSFNGDISTWDVSNVKDMYGMFRESKFTGKNGNISNWDVSNVEDMGHMFYVSSFNGDISNWNVSNVKNMNGMFMESKFTGENGDISKWDVSNDKNNMYYMFSKSPLEKNPPKWYKN